MVEKLTTVKDYERVALARLGKVTREYYQFGADANISLDDSTRRYDAIKLKPKAEVDPDFFEGLETEIMGSKVPSPLCISSTAFHKMAHPDGELGSARAANNSRTPFMLSNWATTSAEEVASVCPDSFKMFQLYMDKNPEV
jgi:(S)-2-hydroxy-acid oxidase